MGMKTLGIIPARYHSTRFPGKPLATIGDKSMIRHIYERVCASQLDDVWVATEDQRIADHVETFGGKVILTSTFHNSGTERCAEAALKTGKTYEHVINIQGDEPFIAPEQINILINTIKHKNADIVTMAEKITSREVLFSESSAKIVLDHQGYALYFSRSVIPFIMNKAQKDWLKSCIFWNHIGIYAFKYAVLQEIVKLAPSNLEKQESLEQLRWLYYGYKIQIIEGSDSGIQVDTPADLEKAKIFYDQKKQ
jgi:3-deoxy-manno-octulosonate cytidylyltransferase (CMP-KDO synthetase)